MPRYGNTALAARLRTLVRGIWAVLLATAVMLGNSTAASAAQHCESWECRKLFNNCSGMDLVVESLPDDAEAINLTREWIISVAEGRLRTAHIFNEDSRSYLYIRVHVVGNAFHVAVEFNKWLADPFLAEGIFAATWGKGGTGTHGQDASYIIGAVTRYVDQFVVEFLRVRDKTCS